jgi:hypothetical protein
MVRKPERTTINVDADFAEFLYSQKRRGQTMQEVIEDLIEIADEENSFDCED